MSVLISVSAPAYWTWVSFAELCLGGNICLLVKYCKEGRGRGGGEFSDDVNNAMCSSVVRETLKSAMRGSTTIDHPRVVLAALIDMFPFLSLCSDRKLPACPLHIFVQALRSIILFIFDRWASFESLPLISASIEFPFLYPCTTLCTAPETIFAAAMPVSQIRKHKTH